MERYFKFLIVALLTTTSFALTSCCNDEPNGPDDGGNTSSEIAFNLNGKDYYWEGDLWDIGLYDPSTSWGQLSVSKDGANEQYIFAIATYITAMILFGHP